MTTSLDTGLSDTEVQTWLDDNLNSHILGYYVHGVYTGLFGMAIWQLLAVKKISRARICMGCIITALYTFSVVRVIASLDENSRTYVSATSLRARYNLANSPFVLWDTVGFTMSGLNLIIADCTIIWRCWVVWAHSWKVTILPILFVIGGIVCGVNVVVHQDTVSSDDETGTKWSVATMATTLGTNILCTALIVARIVYVARGHRGILGGIRTYRGVLEILVESAALYSLTFIILMILYPIEGSGYMYPQALSFPVTGIAPTLIILRVASGEARPDESAHEALSSLHFQQRSRRSTGIEATTYQRENVTLHGNMESNTLIVSGSDEQV
ncbi:hypothetical protein EDD18DRAFT_209398 [Armillaria luteobubalina]|uniref:Uncharacterized protein n=1 Tax=Armillaria luteobubalina TaxID=153913 RepID=A0AA39UX32_9AGAR|nr:hypothetical protein EDD18DRAFT_209398 [Armillaria luteobubalina]